jgi:hypothetical protein
LVSFIYIKVKTTLQQEPKYSDVQSKYSFNQLKNNFKNEKYSSKAKLHTFKLNNYYHFNYITIKIQTKKPDKKY